MTKLIFIPFVIALLIVSYAISYNPTDMGRYPKFRNSVTFSFPPKEWYAPEPPRILNFLRFIGSVDKYLNDVEQYGLNVARERLKDSQIQSATISIWQD